MTLGYAATADSGNQTRTAVPGLDIRLGTAHDGINIGWSSLVTAVPEGPTDTPTKTDECPLKFVPPLGWRRQVGTETRRWGWFVWQRPGATGAVRLVQAGHAGVAVGLSPQMKGLELGFGRQSWVMVPTNQHGSWTLSLGNGVTSFRQSSTNQAETP